MAYSKIIYGGNVLIDLTGDTVAADKLLAGITAADLTLYAKATQAAPTPVQASTSSAQGRRYRPLRYGGKQTACGRNRTRPQSRRERIIEWGDKCEHY